ncbi:unnamed protein product [Clonostachys rosea f. rosea IK726]|uniref:D-xylose 1-dehydrogenase (NADP(+), D-xylono-1,5-lactone-forming) n=2 Tax=Bionectria ochroleuca TaxID=29856 RepID=A0A0B7JY55_BIOOC|nr:unnamed protein product [Clonostachys rosea f. rosea IK726]
MATLLKRIFTAFDPPSAEKRSDAIKIGILGAARTAPMSLIVPAKSHPEVIVQAISARDRTRAEEFAKKHGIPQVMDSYQEILDDPNIDAIFIPLPNTLHMEWPCGPFARASTYYLRSHRLFNMPELSQPNAPVILEAFHNRFHPAVQLLHSFVTPADVVHVYADGMVPWAYTSKGDIGFNYRMGGGSMMHMGTYSFAMIRAIYDAEPEECLSVDYNVFDDGEHDKCDYAAKATFRFPNGGIAESYGTLRGPLLWKPSEVRVTHKGVVVDDPSLPKTQEKVRTRHVTMHGFMHAVVWHRIDVKDAYAIRNKADGSPIKKWSESKSYKAYTFKEAGGEFAKLPGEDWWMSYRHQLEQFVNRIRGRGTQYWISADDSIHQMRMVDMAYEKSGLGLRPTSSFQ